MQGDQAIPGYATMGYQAIPEEIARHANDTLEVAVDISDGFREARAPLGVPYEAFGDEDVGGGIARAHTEAVEALEAAVSPLLQAYGRIGYLLYGVAFTYQQADLEAAERLRQYLRENGR